MERSTSSIKMKQKTLWRWWAKALGEKASKCDKESDTVALIRTFIFITYLITNCFIIAGVIRHWNRPNYEVPQHYGINNQKTSFFI
jgi:hypothetical protein